MTKGSSGKYGFETKFVPICAKETKREEGVSGNDTSTNDESPAAKLDKLQSEAHFSEDPKIYAFIDSQNLNLAIRQLDWQLDFRKFRVYLKDKYKVEKAFLFLGYVPNNWNLYSNLKSMGYELIFKPTLTGEKSVVKGNCDGELILHCMIEYHNFDKAIIVSGDGDFYCLIEYLKKNGKLLKAGIPNRKRYSALLRKFKKDLWFINYFRKQLEYKKK